jgi:hypothetical protein
MKTKKYSSKSLLSISVTVILALGLLPKLIAGNTKQIPSNTEEDGSSGMRCPETGVLNKTSAKLKINLIFIKLQKKI